MNKSVLILAAHPDDEVLGCGGTMARLSSEGWDVHIALLAEGISARNESGKRNKTDKALAELKESAKRASDIVGAATLSTFDLPDNRMDSIDLLDIVKIVERLIARFSPSVVYTHHWQDVNIDHTIVARAVSAATRPLPRCPVLEVLSFEVPSSTDWMFCDTNTGFTPNVFVDINKYLTIKCHALKAYAGEMRSFPHPRSIENITALAAVRGAQSGMKAAEAFRLNRAVRR